MNAENQMTPIEIKALKKKIFVRFSLLPIFLIILILLPAGTLNFWEVYAYFAVLVIPMIYVILYFLKKNPRFLERRIKSKEKEKEQKMVVLISSIALVLGYIIPGLDHRFGWSNVPIFIVIIADIFVLLGYVFVFFVFQENSYASRIIEVSENQKVISTGPYKFVRHPMYSGMLIMYLSTPLALGSYWALIPFSVFHFSLVLRIINEEKILSDNLHGYQEYCQKTKYRVIPRIW